MRNLCERHTCVRVAAHISQFAVTLIKITMQIRRNQATRHARVPERIVGSNERPSFSLEKRRGAWRRSLTFLVARLQILSVYDNGPS